MTSPVFTYIYTGTLTKRRNLYSSDGLNTNLGNLGIDTMINKPGIHMLHVGRRIFKRQVSVSRT
jgi:hypothetical protein